MCVAAACGLALAAAGCSAFASDKDDIEVGMLVSLSGRFSTRGRNLQNAVRVAEGQINQAEILDGRHIKYKFVDDASKNEQALAAVAGLLNDKPAGILGPGTSPQVAAVQDAIYQRKVVQISATATSPLLASAQPSRDRYFFRTAPSDAYQGKAIAKLVYDGVPGMSGPVGGGCTAAAFVASDDVYATPLHDVIAKEFSARPSATMISDDIVPFAVQEQYAMLAAKIVAERPQCLVLVTYPDVGAQILYDLRTAIAADTSGYDWTKLLIAGVDAQYNPSFISLGQSDPNDDTSPNATENVLGTAPDTAPATPEYGAFRAIWHQKLPGIDPAPYASNQYDAAIILALAIQQAGTATNGTAIRDAMFAVTQPGGTAIGPAQFADGIAALRAGKRISYHGASGPCVFDDVGNVTADYVVWRVQRQRGDWLDFVSVGKVTAAELGGG
jgi:ABC-type branched-subunit amino acid transport system substrate-binding protein